MRKPELREQELLERYLTRGITTFQRSTTGAMLYQLGLFSHSSVPCFKCNTSGILESGDWCPKCKGIGVIAYLRDTSASGNVTARPTTVGQHSLRDGVDDDCLTDYAIISRALSKLLPNLRLAIEVAFGEDGAWCERSQRWDRSWSLAPHTVPGAKLLRDAEHGGQERLLERLTAVAMVDEGKSKPSRAGQLLAARNQAKAWLEEATQAWDAIFDYDEGEDGPG